MVWMDAKQQGKKKDGSFNTQRELQAETMNIKDLLTVFRMLLTIYLPHCQEIQWIKEMISWICCIFMAGRLKQPFPGAARAGAAGVEPGAHVEVRRSALTPEAPANLYLSQSRGT